jgi:hypothetical protein
MAALGPGGVPPNKRANRNHRIVTTGIKIENPIDP